MCAIGATRVECCAPLCKLGDGGPPLFIGIPATDGGSQHKCAFCDGHFHAICGATDTEAVVVTEWCGCKDGFDNLEEADQETVPGCEVGGGKPDVAAPAEVIFKKHKGPPLSSKERQARHREKKRLEKMAAIGDVAPSEPRGGHGLGAGRGWGRGRGQGGKKPATHHKAAAAKQSADLDLADKAEGHLEEADFLAAYDMTEESGEKNQAWSDNETARLMHCLTSEKMRPYLKQLRLGFKERMVLDDKVNRADPFRMMADLFNDPLEEFQNFFQENGGGEDMLYELDPNDTRQLRDDTAIKKRYVAIKGKLTVLTERFNSSGRAGQIGEVPRSNFCKAKNGAIHCGLLYTWYMAAHDKVNLEETLCRLVPPGQARDAFGTRDVSNLVDQQAPPSCKSVMRCVFLKPIMVS